MTWARGIVAVIAGYVVAAYANMAWVLWWHFGERALDALLLGILTAVMFAASGWVAGALLKLIAGPAARVAGYLASGLVVLAGVVNLSLGLAVEPAWHTLLAMVIQAPVLLFASRVSWGSRAG